MIYKNISTFIIKFNNLVRIVLIFIKYFLYYSILFTGCGANVNLDVSADTPANVVDNKAPAVAPIVVSIAVLLGSISAFSPSCHVVENTNGVASVACAPTLISCAACLLNYQ